MSPKTARSECSSSRREEKRSFCRFCGSFCAIIATVENDRIVDIRGDESDPVSKGYICPKGRALHHFHHHPNRLDHPLIRRNGALEKTSWDEIYDDLTARLRRIIDADGPQAIGGYAGTPTVACSSLYVWRNFLTAMKTPQIYSTLSVDVPCVPLVAERVTGNPMVSSQPDMDARMTILIGVNPIVSHGHVFFMPAPKMQLRRWAAQGELWAIDPRRSETAEIATHHLAARPGSEFILLGYAVRELLNDGADEAFLNDCVDGVEKLKTAVARFTLEKTVPATRLSEEQVKAFVAAIRKAGRVAIHCGTGISMGKNANATTYMMWALHAVTGSLDRKGGAYFNPGFARNLNEHGWEPMNTSGPGPKSRPDLPSRLGEYPCAALTDEIESGELKALFCFAGNPLIALPDTERLLAAFRKLDLLVMIDVIDSPNTQLATHVLPSTGQLEMSDLIAYDFLNPTEYTRYAPRVVEPHDNRKPLWSILGEISTRIGVDMGINDDIAHDDDVLEALLTTGRAGFDEARGAATALVSKDRTYDWVHKHLPNGRWNLGPDDLIAQLDEAAFDDVALVLIPHRQKLKLNSQLSDGAANPRRPDKPVFLINPEDAVEHGVKDGNKVEISTATGRVVARARLDDRLSRGVSSLPHGFTDINVNLLTDAHDTDSLSGMVTLGAFPIDVRCVEPDEQHS